LARKASQQLTEAELRLMNALWNKGQGTVGEIAESVDADPPLAYSTVLTTLRILENKGYVRHTKQSRAFVYEPTIDREQASSGAVRHLLKRFFNDSPELLVANLLRDEKLQRRDFEKLRKLIAEHK
jgi:predicted transcriptional regulator